MDRSMIAVVALIASSLLTGCAGVASRTKGNYEFDHAGNKGLIAFSDHLVDKCGGIDVFGFMIFRKDKSGFPETVPVKNFLLKPDLGDNGYFFVYELDGGEYTIAGVGANGLSFINLHTTADEIVNFTVKPGIVTYLGQVEFTVNSGCNMLNTEISDQWGRDAKFFERRIPNISPSTVKTHLGTVKINSDTANQ